MTGLRDKMKRRRRQAVLDAAERLFQAHGYSQTNIEDIAAEAEVSIGTLYTYFGSKGGVMHELIQPVIRDMEAKAQAIIDNPPDDPADSVAAMYEAYRFSDDWKSLNVLRAFSPGTTEVDKHLTSVPGEFETFIQRQLEELLDKMVAEGRFNPALDTADIAAILYLLMFGHFQKYVVGSGDVTYEDVLIDLHRRLRLLFQPWLPAA